MKYYYKIVNQSDPTDVPMDTSKLPRYPHNTSYKAAEDEGKASMKDLNLNSNQYLVKVLPVAETVVEEDELAGHPYPGHETWPDNY